MWLLIIYVCFLSSCTIFSIYPTIALAICALTSTSSQALGFHTLGPTMLSSIDTHNSRIFRFEVSTSSSNVSTDCPLPLLVAPQFTLPLVFTSSIVATKMAELSECIHDLKNQMNIDDNKGWKNVRGREKR